MTIAEAMEFADLSKIFRYIRSDSVLKLPEPYIDRWIPMNFSQLTDSDREKISRIRKEGFAAEWSGLGQEHLDTITEAILAVGLGSGNVAMNDLMANMIIKNLKRVSILIKMRSKLHVAGLGCGNGGSEIALIKRIRELGWVKEVELFLLNPAKKELDVADKEVRRTLKELGVPFKVTCKETLIEDHLEDPEFISFLKGTDVVLMGASLHHMEVYPVLGCLRSHLPNRALVGLAEWAHAMLQSPGVFRKYLVREMDRDVDPGCLKRFDEHFPEAQFEEIPEFEVEELAAIRVITGFWVMLGRIAKEKGICAAYSPFEGHMPWNLWISSFKEHGFQLASGPKIVTPRNNLNGVVVFKS